MAVGSAGLVDGVFDLVVPFGFDGEGALGAVDDELSVGGGGEGEAVLMGLNGGGKLGFGSGEGLGDGVVGAVFDVGA